MSQLNSKKLEQETAVVGSDVSTMQKSPKELKNLVDEVILDVLEDIGFYRNVWKFEPRQVRHLLRGLVFFMGFLSVWSWSHTGRQRWTFTIFEAVLFLVYYVWYYKVECGGGVYLFSPDWRDTFLRTSVTKTNYVIALTVGYELNIGASIPFASLEHHLDNDGLDEEWLGDEIEQQFGTRWN